MRYELTDHEWFAIKPFLPNKPRGARAFSQWRSGLRLAITTSCIILDRRVRSALPHKADTFAAAIYGPGDPRTA